MFSDIPLRVPTMLRLNRERGITLLLVTHSERLAERMVRVVRLMDGKVVSIEQGRGGD